MALQIHSWIRRLGALTLAMGFILLGLPHARVEVKAEPQGIVAMRTGFGGTRIVDMLVGEQLPRIC